MFYSKDILVRKDNSFGLIWLAATMGSNRSGINKLSKKEVIGVDIVKTCKDISQPPEPFALRFSSNLMMGVARVYGQQYNFYYSDVNSMWMRLKRDLTLVQSESVDMIHPEAKIDAITFDYDLAVEHQILRPLKVIQDYDLELARGSRSKELAIEFGWASQSTGDLRDSLSISSLSPTFLSMGINGERRRRITLDEASILEAARPELDFGERFNFDVPDDALVGEDIGLYIDSEGNLVDYAPTLGIAGSSDGLLVPQVSGMAVSLGKHSRDVEGDRYHPTEDPDFMQIGDILYMPQDQEQIIDPNLQLDLVAVQRQPKSMKLIIDDHTMLPREDILESEENFQLNQAALIQKRRLKQNIAYSRECIESFMSRPLGVSGYGPDLEAFWGSASVRTIATLSTGQLHNAAPQFEQFDDDPFLFDTEQDMLPEPPEPEEVRRRQMSVDTATSMDLGGGGFGLGGSRIVGHMPWSVDLHASVSAQSEHSSADSEYLRREFEAAFDKAPGRPTQGQRARLGGLNEESLMRSRNTRRGRSRSQTGSRDISRGTSRQRTDSVDAGRSGSSMSGYDPFLDLVGQHQDITMYQQNPGVTPSQLVVERETVNFIEYVRSILREANTNSFSFEDVITIHRRRDVAASAFYHILSLSTMGKMYPTQDAPYQDIQVELTE